MARTPLAVRFTTEGFDDLRKQLSAAGKSFDDALGKAKAASQEAIAESKRAAGDVKALEEAQKAFRRAAQDANNAVAGSFRELRVKSTADINAQKQAAISAFEAIKKSGTASAQDVANAQVALKNRLNELDGQLDQTKGKVNDVTDGFTVFKGVLSNLISGGIQAGLSAIAGLIQNITKGIIGFGQQSVGVFMRFDGAMKAFAAKAGGATQEQIKAVSDEAKKLGIATSKTPAQIAQMAASLAGAGFTAEQTKDSLGGIVLASEASGESLEEVGRIVGATLNQFRLSAKDTQRVADILAAGERASATSISGLGEGLKYIGAIAGGANQSLEDMTVVLGLLTNGGLEAGQAGRNFASAFERLEMASIGASDGTNEGTAAMKKQQEAIKELGIEFRQADGQMRPFLEVLPQLAKRMKELSPERQADIRKTLFGTEGGRAIVTLLSQVETKLADVTEAVYNSQGAAGEASAQLMKGLGPALELLQSSWEVLLQDVGEAIAPTLDQVVRLTTSWVNELRDTEGLFDGLKKLSQQVTDFFEKNPEIIKAINAEMTALVKDAFQSASDLASQLLDYLTQNPKAIAETIRGMGELVGGALKGAVNLAQSLLNYFRENKEQVAAIGKLLQGAGKLMQVFLDLVLKSAEGWGKILYYAKQVFGLAGNTETSRDMIERAYGSKGSAAFQREYDRLEREELNKYWFHVNSPLGTLKGEAAQKIAEQAYANVLKNPSVFGLTPKSATQPSSTSTPSQATTASAQPKPQSSIAAPARTAIAKADKDAKEYLEQLDQEFSGVSKTVEETRFREEQALSGLQKNIADSYKAAVKANRQMLEAFEDLSRDLNIQIEAARSSLQSSKDQLSVNQLKLSGLQLTPGNSNSVVRQLQGILVNFVERSFGSQNNERQIKIDILNLEKERIQRLRQVRELEEQNREAIENHRNLLQNLGRQVFDLGKQFQGSSQQIKAATNRLVASINTLVASSKITSKLANSYLTRAAQLSATQTRLTQPQLPAPTPPKPQASAPVNTAIAKALEPLKPLGKLARLPGREVARIASAGVSDMGDGLFYGGGEIVAQGFVDGLLNQVGRLSEFLGNLGKTPGKTLEEFANYVARQNADFWYQQTGPSGNPYTTITQVAKALLAGQMQLPGQNKPNWLQETFNRAAKERGLIAQSQPKPTTQKQKAPPQPKQVMATPKPQSPPPAPSPAPKRLPIGDRLKLALEYVQLYNHSHQLGLTAQQMHQSAKGLAEFRVADKALQSQFEKFIQATAQERQAIANQIKSKVPQLRKIGDVLNGKVWAGPEWGWQTKENFRQLQKSQFKKPPQQPKAKPKQAEEVPVQVFDTPVVSGGMLAPLEGVAPPLIDYSGLTAGVEELTQIQGETLATQLANNQLQQAIDLQEALDQLRQMAIALEDANRQNVRSYIDQEINIRQMQAAAKGYLTIAEQIERAGTETFFAYENQLRSLTDQSRAVGLRIESLDKANSLIQETLRTDKQLTEEKRSQLMAQSGIVVQEAQQLTIYKARTDEQIRALATGQKLASLNAMSQASFEASQKALTAFVEKYSELVALREEIGGDLFNGAGIYRARVEMAQVERSAIKAGREAGLDGDRLREYVELSKEVAALNLKKAYREAVPYVRDLSSALRQIVQGTGGVGETLQGLFQKLLDDIWERWVANPLESWLSETLSGVFGLGQQQIPVATKTAFGSAVDSLAAGNPYFASGLVNPSALGSPGVVYSGTTPPAYQLDPVPLTVKSLEGLSVSADTASGSLAQQFTQSLVQGATTQTAVVTEFVSALRIATMAVVSFAQSLGSNLIPSVADAILPAFTGAVSGITGGYTGATLPLPAFASGGYTGNGDRLQPAGIVHAGEFVLNKKATQKIGLPTLNLLNRLPGYFDGGYVGLESRLLSGLNTYQSPRLSLPDNGDRRGMAAATTNTVTVNINDKESRFYRQSKTIAREMAEKLRG